MVTTLLESRLISCLNIQHSLKSVRSLCDLDCSLGCKESLTLDSSSLRVCIYLRNLHYESSQPLCHGVSLFSFSIPRLTNWKSVTPKWRCPLKSMLTVQWKKYRHYIIIKQFISDTRLTMKTWRLLQIHARNGCSSDLPLHYSFSSLWTFDYKKAALMWWFNNACTHELLSRCIHFSAW